MARVLIPLAEGVEEMEAVIIVDTLRRAGWDVVTAGTVRGAVKASRGVVIEPDAAWEDIDPGSFDALVIPGGSEGTRRLTEDDRVLDAVRTFAADNRYVAAICAGPLVLQAAGVLDGRNATCHPAVQDRLTAAGRCDDRVAIDGRIVTSQGPGTAFAFALALLRLLEGPETADRVRREMLVTE